VYSDDETLRETQEMVFNRGIRSILEKWEEHDRTRLHTFCQYCTGQTFLNTDPRSNFKVQVVFETKTIDGNSSSDERLPECHTCDPMLSFPRTAYNGNFEVLEAKLTQAVDLCHAQYTMQ